MGIVDILTAQLTDLFRIGMIVMLVLTAARTSGNVGTLVPLLLGIVFIAVLIPMTLTATGDRAMLIIVGLISNLIILGVILAVRAAASKLSQGKR